MQVNVYTPEQFAAEKPRCRTVTEAVEYVEYDRHKARDFYKIQDLAEKLAETKGLFAVRCGQTSHSRQYHTTRFAFVKEVKK